MTFQSFIINQAFLSANTNGGGGKISNNSSCLTHFIQFMELSPNELMIWISDNV